MNAGSGCRSVIGAFMLIGALILAWIAACVRQGGTGSGVQINPLLHVDVVGFGEVVSTPAGIDCGDGQTNCQTLSFPAGSQVTLAVPPQFVPLFIDWQGGGVCSGTSPSLTFMLNGPTTCTARFNQGASLFINVIGAGVGAVFSDPPGISCGSQGGGTCRAIFVRGTTVNLTMVAAAESRFVWGPTGWFNCQANANRQVFVDQTSYCSVDFEPVPGIIPPTNVQTVPASPDFVVLSRTLADRQEINNEIHTSPQGQDLVPFRQSPNLGWPLASVTAASGISRFQVWKEGQLSPDIPSPFGNSIELQQTDSSGQDCIYVAYTDTVTPLWYDAYNAADTDGLAGVDKPIRSWTGLTDRCEDIRANNVYSWFDFLQRPNVTGNVAYTLGRTSPPRWFVQCFAHNSGPPPVVTQEIPQTASAFDFLKDPGSYCGCNTWPWGPPEWYQLCPTSDQCNLETQTAAVYANAWEEVLPRLSWFPNVLVGTVTNSFLSGDDYSGDHSGLPDVSPAYDLGLRDPYHNGDCGFGHARGDYCSDWCVDVKPDPEFRMLMTNRQIQPNFQCYEDQDTDGVELDFGNWDHEYHGNMENEEEQWMVPTGYRPEPGDRIQMIGRWIVDCGHADYHTEIHPWEAYASTFLQTGPLLDGSFPNYIGTWNKPPITDNWFTLTRGRPATVTKVVVSADWQGSPLAFNIWPPPRPSATSRLHWAIEERDVERVSVAVLKAPTLADNTVPSNPNHLRIIISDGTPSGFDLDTDTNYIQNPRTDRRYVAAYMLWWEETCPPGATCGGPGGGGGRP